MVVKIEDARLEVELDTRQALRQLGEIESKLGQARARRGRRTGEAVDPGQKNRVGGRRLAAAAVTGRAAARGAGIGGAVRFAAKLGAGLTIAEVIRQAPALLPALLGEETLSKEIRDLIPLPDAVLAATGIDDALGGTRIQDVVEGLGKRIAEIEALLKTTVKAATLAYDLLAEGRLAEAGAGAILEIRRAISPGSATGVAGGGPLGIGEEAGAILDAFRAYNTAEAIFRQRTVHARADSFLENQQRGFRAAGGGVSK